MTTDQQTDRVTLTREAWQIAVEQRAAHELGCASCQPGPRSTICLEGAALAIADRVEHAAYVAARFPDIEGLP